MKSVALGLLLAGAVGLAPCHGAEARTACVEGTVQGKCVNPHLARTSRQGAVVRTEAHLSVSSHNYPPSEDWQYAYPNNVDGAQQFGSGRSSKPGLEPAFSSVPTIVYGIRN
jgi:hypothetical protein